MELTYQGVHKALQELEKEHILAKTKNNWQINSAWLDSQASFIRKTQQKYSGSKNKYAIDLNYDGPQTFEFDSFTDLCVETANVLSDKISNSANGKLFFLLEYGWCTLKFKFAHFKLIRKLLKINPNGIHIIRKVTPFGTWIQKQYERVGGIGRIGVNFPFEDDLAILGDWVVQIHFSEESKKTILKYWKKWRTLEDSFIEFGLKPEPKMKITVTVSKNPTMARFMSQEMERYLKEAKNHAK